MNRRKLLKISAQMTVAGLAASRLPLAYADEKSSVKHTVWSPPVAPIALLAVAAKQGKLHDSNPYDVKVWKGPDQLRSGVASGKISMTMVPSYVAANFANRGKPVALGNIMTFGLLQMVARDTPLKSMEELVGKSIVMPYKNDMPDLVLQVLCKNTGIDFSALNIQYVNSPPEALAMFLKQRAEVAFLPEPLTTVAIFKGKKMGQNVVRAMDFQQQWGNAFKIKPRIPQAGMQIDRGFYSANKPFVDQLLLDIQTAATSINAKPSDAADFASAYLPIPKPILTKSLPQANLTGEFAADISDEILFFFEQLHKLNPKIIGGKMPTKALFQL